MLDTPTYELKKKDQEIEILKSSVLKKKNQEIEFLKSKVYEMNKVHGEMQKEISSTRMKQHSADVQAMILGSKHKKNIVLNIEGHGGKNKTIKSKANNVMKNGEKNKRGEGDEERNGKRKMKMSIEKVEIKHAKSSVDMLSGKKEKTNEVNNVESSENGSGSTDVKKIYGGRINKDDGECILSISFVDDPNNKYDIPAAALLQDEHDFKTLLWIITNKGQHQEWRRKICQVIGKLKKQQGSPFMDMWVDWATFVKQKVEEGLLLPKCLSQLEDGGGKPPAKINYDLVVVQSPLKEKLPPCKVHDFVEETNKKTAKKGSGYILDGISCEECKKEFVEQQSDAINPGNAIVITYKNGAWWCRTCKMVLCKECHVVICQNVKPGKSRRVVNMND